MYRQVRAVITKAKNFSRQVRYDIPIVNYHQRVRELCGKSFISYTGTSDCYQRSAELCRAKGSHCRAETMACDNRLPRVQLRQIPIDCINCVNGRHEQCLPSGKKIAMHQSALIRHRRQGDRVENPFRQILGAAKDDIDATLFLGDKSPCPHGVFSQYKRYIARHDDRGIPAEAIRELDNSAVSEHIRLLIQRNQIDEVGKLNHNQISPVL